MITYKGFSTLYSPKKFTVVDFELAKRDLLNYFSIRKGEKLMQPEFGTVIWSLLFEPLTSDVQQTITDDITRIVGYDPRLRVVNIKVSQQTTGFLIEINLAYVLNDQSDTIRLNFDNNSNKLIAV